MLMQTMWARWNILPSWAFYCTGLHRSMVGWHLWEVDLHFPSCLNWGMKGFQGLQGVSLDNFSPIGLLWVICFWRRHDVSIITSYIVDDLDVDREERDREREFTHLWAHLLSHLSYLIPPLLRFYFSNTVRFLALVLCLGKVMLYLFNPREEISYSAHMGGRERRGIRSLSPWTTETVRQPMCTVFGWTWDLVFLWFLFGFMDSGCVYLHVFSEIIWNHASYLFFLGGTDVDISRSL